MPEVGKKKFPYTKKGKAAAKKEAARKTAATRSASRLQSFDDWKEDKRGKKKVKRKKQAGKSKNLYGKSDEAFKIRQAKIQAAERLIAKGKMEPLTDQKKGKDTTSQKGRAPVK